MLTRQARSRRVEFEVDGVNDAPRTVVDAATINEIGPATLNVLANDFDIDTNDAIDVRNFQFLEFKVNGETVSDANTPPFEASENITVNGFEQDW